MTTSIETRHAAQVFVVTAHVACQRRYALRGVIEELLGFLRPALRHMHDAVEITVDISALDADAATAFLCARLHALSAHPDLRDLRVDLRDVGVRAASPAERSRVAATR